MAERKSRFEEVRPEDIMEITNAQLQSSLSRIPDFILFAGLKEAPISVKTRLAENISSSRKQRILEVGAEAGRLSERTKKVAWRVIVKSIIGIEDEEVKSYFGTTAQEKEPRKIEKKDYVFFIKKLSESHPDFKTGSNMRMSKIAADYIKKFLLRRNDA